MIRRFVLDRTGTAAAEFVLALPMMLALMIGAMEAGHYFWTQHKIVKSVRDGVRYAARLDVADLCANDAQTLTDIRNVTATGQVPGGGIPKVPGWNPANVVVTISCDSFVSTGIYSDLGEKGPLVTVASSAVPYPSLFDALGFIDGKFALSAQSSTAVMGV